MLFEAAKKAQYMTGSGSMGASNKKTYEIPIYVRNIVTHDNRLVCTCSWIPYVILIDTPLNAVDVIAMRNNMIYRAAKSDKSCCCLVS